MIAVTALPAVKLSPPGLQNVKKDLQTVK